MSHVYMAVQILFIALLSVALSYSKMSYAAGGARKRFEEKFQKTCMKYDFVQKYVDNIKNPTGDYVIFVFHEAGQKAHGGLGDRVAGMITAAAYAIRTQRTLLIQADPAFEEAFRPYYPTYSSFEKDNKSPDLLPNGKTSAELSWRSWDWANWSREYAGNLTKLHCVNPRPQEKHCSLDVDYYKKYKVVKYYGNRSYLCRWVVKRSLGVADEVARLLDMKMGADLYEIAGCMLRLAMWPTEKLWQALDESLVAQFQEYTLKNVHNTISSSGSTTDTTTTDTTTTNNNILPIITTGQVGIHFRCGDSSFTTSTSGSPNPECYYDTTGKIPWKGTAFSDDHSIDSPVDAANCAKQIFTTETQNISKNIHSNSNNIAEKDFHTKHILAYIASDNSDSSRQVNTSLSWPYTIKPPQACHMDISKTLHCTLSTSLQWFMLSLSDVIIMQALIKPPASVYSNSPETAHIHDDEPAPISAFSRYAAIYSLSDRVIRYGKGCVSANTTALSYQTHGNWVCDPQMFY